MGYSTKCEMWQGITPMPLCAPTKSHKVLPPTQCECQEWSFWSKRGIAVKTGQTTSLHKGASTYCGGLLVHGIHHPLINSRLIQNHPVTGIMQRIRNELYPDHLKWLDLRCEDSPSKWQKKHHTWQNTWAFNQVKILKHYTLCCCNFSFHSNWVKDKWDIKLMQLTGINCMNSTTDNTPGRRVDTYGRIWYNAALQEC